MYDKGKLISRIVGVAIVAVLAFANCSSALADKIKVVGLFSPPVQQKWVYTLHRVLVAEKEAGEIDYSYSESITNPTEYLRKLRDAAAAKPDLIIAEGFQIPREAREVAKANPNVAFLMADAGEPQQPNYSVFDSWNQEGTYLTGMLAGAMTKTNKIGMVGGYPIPDVNRTFNSFMAGASAMNPNAKFKVAYTSSWYDPPKEKEFAMAQIDGGVDAVFAERAGVVPAARERHILAFGIINDMNKLESGKDVVVGSALWDMTNGLKHAISSVKAHQYKAEDYKEWSMMKSGGTVLSPYYEFEDRIPADVRTKVKETADAIVAGKFDVKIDNSEPKSTF
jgi:basic membrane protein A and related proteins